MPTKPPLLILAIILLRSLSSIGQNPIPIYKKYHHTLSIQPTYTSIKFKHQNKDNVSSAALGIQLRYHMHFPINTLYSVSFGWYLSHNTYKFDKPFDPLGLLNDVKLSGALSSLQPDNHDRGRIHGPQIRNHFSYNSAGIPVLISGHYPISHYLSMKVSMGINLNGILMSEIYHERSYANETTVNTDYGEKVVIRTHLNYENHIPQLGFLMELGPQYTMRNGTTLSLSFTANLNFVTKKHFEYDLYPSLGNLSSSGYMETSGSYFGFGINYVFVEFLRY